MCLGSWFKFIFHDGVNPVSSCSVSVRGDGVDKEDALAVYIRHILHRSTVDTVQEPGLELGGATIYEQSLVDFPRDDSILLAILTA